MDRRNFLALGGAALVAGCGMPDLRRPYSRISTEVRTRTNTVVQSPELLQKIEQNRSLNTQEDILLAKQLLCDSLVCSDEQLVVQVEDFQRRNGLEIVGYIGPQTLENIYNAALENGISLTATQMRRVEIYFDLERFRHISDRGRFPTSVPHAFNNRKFFGGGDVSEFTNIPGTYITSSLVNHVPERDNPNTLYVEIINGKYALRLYDMQGNLYVASYVSPGTRENSTPEQQQFQTNTTDLYHVSSSFPEDTEGLGAPMYAATHVVNGVWIHSSADAIDGYGHSHGCIRTGLLFARAIHDYVAQNGPINIVIGDLY